MTPKQLRDRQARMAAQVVVDAFKCRVYDTMCLDPRRCTSENACCAGEVELRDAANGPPDLGEASTVTGSSPRPECDGVLASVRGPHAGATEPHTCPYQEDVNDNKRFKCRCCRECEQECADDI